MIGSTLIYEPNPSRLAHIDMDNLEQFSIIELESLITLDFEVICQKGDVRWTAGEPLLFDEESGMVVLPVSEPGIKFVCNHSAELDETQKSDQAKIKAFIEEHGANNIYELATF